MKNRGCCRGFLNCALFLFGSFNRADAGAGSAFDAFIGIDDIFSVFFGNAAHRAVVGAGSAADALFGIDYIRHNLYLRSDGKAVFHISFIFYHKTYKCQTFFIKISNNIMSVF